MREIKSEKEIDYKNQRYDYRVVKKRFGRYYVAVPKPIKKVSE